MEMPIAAHDIAYAEDLLAEGELETAGVLLEELASEAGEYADTACIATDARQWFSFSSPFEYLAYRRVERDPRELTQVEAPLDRLYADLAYVYIQRREYESARDALKQAVRWNPMNCAHRLNLAEVFRVLGDTQEWAALSASVLDRATTPQALARAFANLGQFFLSGENLPAAEGCRRAAIRACDSDSAATALAAQLDKEHPELAELTDESVNLSLIHICAAFIISDAYEDIEHDILHAMDRGCTRLMAQGSWTKKDRPVLFFVLSRREVSIIKTVVYEHDANAMLIITDVNEAIGYGFKSVG